MINTLDFAYTSDDGQEVAAVLDRVPGPWIRGSKGIGGTEFSAAGVPSSYEVRRDQLLHLPIRVRESEWPQLREMLEHAQRGTAITLTFDGTSRSCYMVEPAMGMEILPQRDQFIGDYRIDTVWRESAGTGLDAIAYHKGTVLGQPVVLQLAGGQDLSDWTFSRTAVSGADTYVKRDGTLGEVTADDIARTEWLDTDGDGVMETPSWLLELSRENLVTWSDALSNWSTSGTPPAAVDASVSAGDLDLALLEDDSAGAAQNYRITPSFTGDGVKSIAVAVKEGSAAAPAIQLYDSTDSAARLFVSWSFSGGVPTASPSTGSQIGDAVALANGIYVFRFKTTAVTAGNTNILQAYPAGATASNTGTAYMGGFMAVDAEFCGSLIKTAGAAVTRNAETAYIDLPPAIATPTAMAIYCRFEERGSIVPGDNRRLFQFGETATDQLALVRAVSGNVYQVFSRNVSDTAGSSFASTPAIGDDVEIVMVLDTDGNVSGAQSINEGGVETASEATLTGGLEPSWSTNARLYLNGDGGTNDGANAFRDVVAVVGDLSGYTGAQLISAFRAFVDRR